MNDLRLPEGMSLAERQQYLADNADKILEGYPYTVKLSQEELDELYRVHGQNAVRLQEIAQRKKEALALYKEEAEPFKEENKEILDILRTKHQERKGTVYEFKDYEAGKVFTFDANGVKVDERDMSPSDRQGSILRNLREGTNG